MTCGIADSGSIGGLHRSGTLDGVNEALKSIGNHIVVWFVSMLLAAIVGAVTALTMAGYAQRTEPSMVTVPDDPRPAPSVTTGVSPTP